MAKKAEEGRIELGTFEAKALNEGGAEARLSDEKNQSNLLSRSKGVNKSLELGATYTVYAEKVADAPPPPTVTATVPFEDAGSLPSSAVINKEAGEGQ